MSELRLEYVSVSELVPYDKNPRKNDAAAEKVAELIKEYGFKKPILVDIKNNKNEIIAGHTRLKAALLLGIEKVPVIFADDLSPEQVKAFRIADNKSSEWAEWDISLLTEEISDLSETGFDIDLTGFSEVILENTEETAYSPNLKPVFSIPQVSNEDLEQARENIEHVTDKNVKQINAFCPNCGHEFMIGV
jgi:ParB-like chromosome segregation protein Spo0J